MMRQVFGSAALWLLGLAAISGAAFALLSLLIEPLYVFTEWVPEVIVEWSSLEARFWELTTAMAKPVKVQTAEYARVCFFGTLLRWGVISALCAVILNPGAPPARQAAGIKRPKFGFFESLRRSLRWRVRSQSLRHGCAVPPFHSAA